jgi:hypothetical protein
VAAAALVLALFEPIAARTYRERLRSRVIVGVDVSQSMETADPVRSVEGRLLRAGEIRVNSKGAVEQLARREVARRLIEPRESPIARLAGDHMVEVLAFARDLAPASLATLAEALKQPLKTDDPATQITDWQPVLAEALKSNQADAPALGIVLLTDGRQNAPGDPLPVVDRLAARGVPVYPILIGSTVPPRDAAIASVKAPESVYRGDVVNLEATLKIDGYSGREVAVTLDRPGGSPLRQTVRAPAGTQDPRPTAAFRFPLHEVGMVPLTIAVGPLEGDVRPDNDRRTVWIHVTDDKARVLLVDGEARWEFRYARNALSRDPRVTVQTVVFHQPEVGGMTKHAHETRIPARADSPPNAPDPLGGFTAVVIGDVAPADLPAEVWTRLEFYVAERGGTLILSPGPNYWAMFFDQSTARRLSPVLGAQLVVIDPGSTDPAHPALPPGIAVVPTAAGSDASAWPMLQFASDPAENRAIWFGLPRLPWVVAGRAKPGAATLAYGLGKVLWVGTDGTWRWRHRVGDLYHHRFWGQVVRWAAAEKLMAGNAFVRFGPVRPRVTEGDGVRLQARISEGIPNVGPNLLAVARLFKTDPKTHATPAEAAAVVPLHFAPGQPRTFEGDAPPLPAGHYVIRLDVPQLAEPLHINPSQDGKTPEATLDVTARESSERIELAALRDPLDRLAGATGGRVFLHDEADQLVPLLRAQTKEITRTEETPLWDRPGALLVFIAILAIEWVVRKRAGLP